MGGTVPGCLPRGRHRPIAEWGSAVRNKAGQQYTIYVGYVDVRGTAATIRDTKTGATAPVLADGYFLFAEPALRLPAPPHAPPWIHKWVYCAGCGASLQVLNAAGQALGPTLVTAPDLSPPRTDRVEGRPAGPRPN